MPPLVSHMARKWNALWVTLGACFFISFFIPIPISIPISIPNEFNFGKIFFFWDEFRIGHSPLLGVFAAYMLLVGIALPVVAFVVFGLARNITIISMGLLGFIFFLTAFGRFQGADFVCQLLGILVMSIALIGNSIRQDYPSALLGRLLGGISGGLAVPLLLIGLIISLKEVHLIESTILMVFNIIFLIVCTLVLMAGGVLLAINIKANSRVAIISRTATLLTLIGIGVLLGWQLLLETLKKGDINIWAALEEFQFFLRMRVISMVGLLLMIGIALTGLLRECLFDQKLAPSVIEQ